ncbi:MAG: hypothetical protein L0027_05920 [Candidatus Rokubacteria bacterium]|nr:hypothetical protein [Candidatus Rokubacteria bacterium]
MAGRAIAVVRDLFFVARLRETARLAGRPLVFARTPAELTTALDAEPADLVIVDLTTAGWDYAALLSVLDGRVPRVPVLGYTTHVLARETQPLHHRCDRVVTKETLTRELGDILARGLAA